MTTRASLQQRRIDESVEGAADTDLRTYVLDTSVLLSDPRAFFRFAEHSVVVPVVVITELEGKRHDPEIGYFARQALRHLDELRVEHGRLDFAVPVGEGGTLRVELTNTDSSVLPAGMRLGDNDTRILSVAMHLAADGQQVTVVSKDLPMRVKAASLGINAEEYLAEQSDERREALARVRDVVLEHLPEGIEETIAYGMIAYVVPLDRFADTYNGQPLMHTALANQKQHMSLYLNAIYGDEGLREEFERDYRATGKRYDVGRSCVRFRRLDDLPLDVVGRAIGATSAENLIAMHEAAMAGRKTPRPTRRLP